MYSTHTTFREGPFELSIVLLSIWGNRTRVYLCTSFLNLTRPETAAKTVDEASNFLFKLQAKDLEIYFACLILIITTNSSFRNNSISFSRGTRQYSVKIFPI